MDFSDFFGGESFLHYHLHHPLTFLCSTFHMSGYDSISAATLHFAFNFLAHSLCDER